MVKLELVTQLFKDMIEVKEGIPDFKAYGAGERITSTKFTEVRSPIDLSVIARVPKLEWDIVDRVLKGLRRGSLEYM
ncbi:MAG: hypothetical protein ABWW65_06230 [Thermoprotei archaeon]